MTVFSSPSNNFGYDPLAGIPTNGSRGYPVCGTSAGVESTTTSNVAYSLSSRDGLIPNVLSTNAIPPFSLINDDVNGVISDGLTR